MSQVSNSESVCPSSGEEHLPFSTDPSKSTLRLKCKSSMPRRSTRKKRFKGKATSKDASQGQVSTKGFKENDQPLDSQSNSAKPAKQSKGTAPISPDALDDTEHEILVFLYEAVLHSEINSKNLAMARSLESRKREKSPELEPPDSQVLDFLIQSAECSMSGSRLYKSA